MSQEATELDYITLKDVARRLSFTKTESGVARTMRQIRHWTQNDLLRTRSRKDTGKGIPRLYEEEPTVQIGGILMELSRYGVTVETLRSVSKALYEDWEEEGGQYLLMPLTDIDTFLQVSWTVDADTGRFSEAALRFFDEQNWFGETAFDPAPSSSILINMTQVMGRIYRP